MRAAASLLGIAVLMAFSLPMAAHDPVAADMARSAQAWLQTLSDEQQSLARFNLTDDEREQWGFVPRSRRGVALGDQTAPQRAAGLALVRTVLSTRGFQQAERIIALERVLRELEGASFRDPGRYYLTVFGEPGRPPWGWRFEGHHLSLNVTLPDDHHVTVTPNFFGANPAEVRSGASTGQRTLAEEEDLARQLVQSFDAGQRQRAILSSEPPRDILTGDRPRVQPLDPQGLAVGEMNAEQRELFRRLFEVYVTRFRDEISAQGRERWLTDGVEALHFAWAGGLEPGQGHYYRIQGRTFVIEYDNTQNRANHIHTTFRDFESDFGRDLLKEHYEADHQR